MRIEDIEFNYKKYYKSIEFERLDLFSLLNKICESALDVLYLGSSIHVTPSLVFSNVTYIDNSDLSISFFSDISNLKTFVNKRKRYKEETKISFINADYLKEGSDYRNKHDLVLSIFSPKSFRVAERYLKNKGVLVYLPLPSDEESVNPVKALKLFGEIARNKKGYYFNPTSLKPSCSDRTNTKYLQGDKFVDSNLYQLYVKNQ